MATRIEVVRGASVWQSGKGYSGRYLAPGASFEMAGGSYDDSLYRTHSR